MNEETNGTIFDHFVTDPRTGFSWKKNYDPDQKPEQKITTSSSKKVVQKPDEDIKKEQLDYLKEHEQKVIDLVKAQNSKVESVQN